MRKSIFPFFAYTVLGTSLGVSLSDFFLDDSPLQYVAYLVWLFVYTFIFLRYVSPSGPLRLLKITLPAFRFGTQPMIVSVHHRTIEIWKFQRRLKKLNLGEKFIKQAKRDELKKLHGELLTGIQWAFENKVNSVVVASHLISGPGIQVKLVRDVKVLEPNVQIVSKKTPMPLKEKILLYSLTGIWVSEEIPQFVFSKSS